MESNINSKEISFRGIPIPEINIKPTYQVANSEQVLDKISKMTTEQRRNVTVSGIHYEHKNIADVKLSTGDIVPVEAAIALAENEMLTGYSSGSTMHGGRFLRTKPSPDDDKGKSIHDLPQF